MNLSLVAFGTRYDLMFCLAKNSPFPWFGFFKKGAIRAVTYIDGKPMVQNPWTFVYQDGVSTKKSGWRTHTHTNVLANGELVIFYVFVFPEKKRSHIIQATYQNPTFQLFCQVHILQIAPQYRSPIDCNCP